MIDQPSARQDPSHIQINPLTDGKWGWVVWFSNPDTQDHDGIADSLQAALRAVWQVVKPP